LKLLRVREDADVIDRARQLASTLLAQSPDLAEFPLLAGVLNQRLALEDKEFLTKS
jgi:hypothetical protein